jgi:hypothetical protein
MSFGGDSTIEYLDVRINPSVLTNDIKFFNVLAIFSLFFF